MLCEHFDNGCDDESIMMQSAEDFINTVATFGSVVCHPVDNGNGKIE